MKAKKSGTHRPYPFPEPLPDSWPQPGEKVDLLWADLALQWGKALVLAQHFRQTKEVDPSLYELIMKSLDPNRQDLRLKFCYLGRGRPLGEPTLLPSCAADLADLFDPPPGPRKRRLQFVRPKGSPRKANLQADQQAICIKVADAVVVERKVTLAVKAVAEEEGVSPSTVWRALKAKKDRKTDKARASDG